MVVQQFPAIELLVIALCVAGCAGARPAPHTSPPGNPAPSGYEESKRDWASLGDLGALRTTYGEREDFYSLCERERPLKKAFDALESEDWILLLRISTPWLDGCPVDIDFHLLRAIASSELAREADAILHHQLHRGLLQSVLRSGDGYTSDSPWVVISVSEEYAVLRALGMKAESQALIDGGIDVLTVEVDGRTKAVYFRPDAHFRRLYRELGLSE